MKIWSVKVGDRTVELYDGSDGSFFIVLMPTGDWRAYVEADGFTGADASAGK